MTFKNSNKVIFAPEQTYRFVDLRSVGYYAIKMVCYSIMCINFTDWS